MNTKYGKLISRERDGTLTAVYPEIIIDDEVDFINRNSTFPVTNIGIANAIDNAVDTAKNSIRYAFTSEDGGLGWNESTQRGYVDFSNIPASKVEEIALAIVKPNSAISIDSSSGKIDVDFSKLKPSDIVPLCDSGGGIIADTTNGKLRISFKNINADGFSKLGVLPVANGGTGQTTVANIQAGKDGAGNTITATYVTLATAQNITGAKTFSAKPVLNQVGLDMTVKDTDSTTTRTAQILHANSDNAGYGINLGVGGSGNTVLGAGESCTAQLNELAGNAGENLYLVADGNIYFKPNGNTWSNAKTITLNSAGEMSGLSKVTATEFVGNLIGNLNGDVTGTFYGPCKGNADTASKLKNSVTINGTSFDGSGNITTSSWGTARNIYISDSDGTNTGTAVSVNGAGNATLKLPGTIKASITGNCSGTSSNVTGTVAIANGGTGATTRLAALKNLTNENVGTSAQHFLVITDSWGKGGYCGVTNAKSVLGISNVKNIDQSKAIKGITRSGTTFTYTCLDGTTGTFTQQDNNTIYTHPTTSGNKHIPSGGSSGQILRWSADGTAAWGNDNNTTYSDATQSAHGLMTAADKKKLDGIDSNVIGIPVGSIIYHAKNTVPANFLICNGAAVSRTTYATLFSVIGTTFGAGNGSSTFNVPNLIGRFPEGNATPGTVHNAGLPNITGDFGWTHAGTFTGCFQFLAADPGSYTGHTEYGGSYNHCRFDASRSNSIYGASSTVQPPALTLVPCIRYA